MLKSIKRPLSAILAFCMLITMMPFNTAYAASDVIYVSSNRGADYNDGSQGSPLATVQEAYSMAQDGDTIYLMDDVESEEAIICDENKSITLTGDGTSLTYIGSTPIHNGTEGFLTITNGEVTITNLTVQLPDAYGTNGRVIAVQNANVTLDIGAVIANGYVVYGGGGVRVESGGTLTMYDGAVIRDCYIANNTSAYGGGVEVMSGGTFIMYGGTITGNTIHTTSGYESYGGGVAIEAGAMFEMYGGSISGNSVDTAGGGIYIDTAATAYFEGNLTISGNTADGESNNLYLPDKNAFDVLGNITGEVGITCGNPDYEDIVGVPNGYVIDVEDEEPFTYDDGTYDIRLKEGNLVLYWWTVDVEFIGDGITSENDATETPKGEDYDTVLTPDDGNKLPDEIDVIVDGNTLDPDTDYTYDPETGEVHIPGENVTGDITIDASGDKLYTIRVVATNVRTDTTLVEEVTKKVTTVITLTKMDKYDLPDDVSVSGTCDYTYVDGVITITNVKSEITVVAEGKEIYHTITFDPNGGTCDTTEKVITESQDYIGTLPEPENEGYTFVGWLDEDGNRYTANTENELTDDITLIAEWSANTNIGYQVQHWVEYVDSGANPSYEAGVTETKIVGGKTYYLFQANSYNNGTSDAEMDLHPYLLNDFGSLDINGIVPNADNTYRVIMAPDGSSVFDLYYRRRMFTVTFDPNGGNTLDQSVATATVTYGSLYGVMPDAVRTGYTQLGWYTDATGGEKRVQGDICYVAGDHTLYAHWQSNGDTAYAVIHKLQPLNDNLPVTDSSKYEIYQTENLTGTSDETVDVYSLAITGFTARSDNPTTIYVKPDGSAEVLLYYDRNPIKVVYDSNGGTAVTISNIIYYGGTVSSLAGAPSKVGYEFVGWYLGIDTDTEVQIGDAINDMNPDNAAVVTLYAHWSPRSYKVPLDTDGGIASGDLTVTYDDVVGELPTAEKEGYTFIGWELEDGTEVTEDMLVNKDTLIDVAADGTESAKTLYAKYKANSVTLTFDSSDGNPITNNTLTVTYDKTYAECGAFPTATKDGFVFYNWTFEDGTILNASDVCKLTEDATVYANYITKHFNVYFDANGGTTAEPSEKVVTYGEAFGDMATTSREDYELIGWFTEATGGIQITSDTIVNFMTDTTLYAHWKLVAFSVTYDANGGTGSYKDSGVAIDSEYVVKSASATSITRSGYTLSKWNTSADGNGTDYAVGDKIQMTDNVTLYAQWNKKSSGGSGGGGGGTTTYTITATADKGVTIDPEGKVSVTSGSNKTFTMSVSAGYMISDVLVDGESVGKVTTYTFSNVKADHTIEVKATSLLTDEHIAYIVGYPDNTVRTDANITRGETAMIFYRLLSDSARTTYQTSGSSYSDVNGEWYAQAVATLSNMGILTGYQDGTFRPNQNITRAEFATLAARFDNLENGTVTFSDVPTTHWAYDSIASAAAKGWVSGYPDGTFRPGNHITRAEVVKIVNAVLNRIADKDFISRNSRLITSFDDLSTTHWAYYEIMEAVHEHQYTRNSDGSETWTSIVR